MLTQPALTGSLLAVLLALAALPALGLLPVGPRGMALVGAGLCAIGAALALGYLLAGAPAMPIFALALDGLSGLLLLALFLAGGVVLLAAGPADAPKPHTRRRTIPPGRAPFTPALSASLLAVLALAVLAANATMFVVAMALAALLSLALLSLAQLPAPVAAGRMLARPDLVLAASLPVLASGAFLAGGASGWGMLGWALLLAGLAPIGLFWPRLWGAQALRRAPPGLAMLLAVALPLPALGWLLRLALARNFSGTEFSGSGFAGTGIAGLGALAVCGIVLGAAGTLAGAWRACQATELRGVLAGFTGADGGIVLLALGVALLARGSDLDALAALALAAGLLHLLVQVLARLLLALCIAAVAQGAGTTQLALLGGLIHRMPRATAAALFAALLLAALPPAAGFAGVWLLFQALFASARLGGAALSALLILAVLVLGLALGLRGIALLRLLGVGFLGRPRSPRAAAAEDAPPTIGLALGAVALLGVLAGLLPGAVLRLAGPALRQLVGADLAGRAGLLMLRAESARPGIAPLAILLLLGLAVLLLVLVLRRATLRRAGAAGSIRAPNWEDGFAPPPPWLPFGDPATEISHASFLAEPRLRAPPRWTFQYWALARRRLLRAWVAALHQAAAWQGRPILLLPALLLWLLLVHQ